AQNPPENPPSVHNCDCSHISDRTDARDAETNESESADTHPSAHPDQASLKTEWSSQADGADTTASDERADDDATPSPRLMNCEREALDGLLELGIEDIDRAAKIARQGGDVHTAIFEGLTRDKERQWKVAALLDRGDVRHALRLATCGRQSVQLQCGCCESEENYLPVTCDSRLCSDCQDRKVGQNIEKYENRVKGMDNPVMLTLTEKNFRDPVRGRRTVMEDLAAFRRRTIPFEGTTTRETDDGETVRKSWCWWNGADVDDVDPDLEQWKVKLQEQGKHDLVRRLQQQYVNYEYEDITGTHVGRNIPLDELTNGGIYGIDIKQQGPMRFHVHAHVLIDMAYVPQAAISAVWEDITGDACVVDVRSIYDRAERQNAAEALAETVGYAVKPPEFEELEEELEFVKAAKGCPTVHPFGDLHGLGSPDGPGLICADCERMPQEWMYLGTVEERRDTVGKSWETDRGMDPPDEQ
ncbi:hypothetical protein, partial [Putridiphycobacter roseus]|uniref:hypothetical protein n=1 Tax=Putridiphycobacter roseus TaxID=2219161 RepID=UPI003624F240